MYIYICNEVLNRKDNLVDWDYVCAHEGIYEPQPRSAHHSTLVTVTTSDGSVKSTLYVSTTVLQPANITEWRATKFKRVQKAVCIEVVDKE